MAKCTVVNQYASKCDVDISRKGKWGNPYTFKRGTKAEYLVGSRAESIECYRKYITEGEGRHLLDDLHELKGKVLGCYCKPQACHGDVLVELVEQYCP